MTRSARQVRETARDPVVQTEVWVVLNGEDTFAGTLYTHRRRGTESATFSYAPPYLASPGAYALDPVLPLRAGSYQTPTDKTIFGALGDCAPDRWGRSLISRREAVLAREQGRAARSLGEIDYLLGVRDDLRQGALRFRAGIGPDAASSPFLADDQAGVPALTDLPALLDLADRAERDTADLSDLQRLIRVGSSLGGARPKAHVSGIDGHIAIAKFPSASHDTWNVMRWEKVAHDLAAAAGIEVPTSRLLSLAGRSVLMVIGFVSAMTMLEASDGDLRSYLEIAEVLELVSDRATVDLRQLWRRIVFSVLISNTDDHLRNHGFLHQRSAVWRLAPAFDLNPNPAAGTKYLSTAIDTADTEARLGTAMAVAADHFRLPDEQARRVLQEVARAVSQWQQVAGQFGLSRSEITEMAPAFAALDRVNDL